MEYEERELDEFGYKLHNLKQYLIGVNGIIAGGCFKNLFNNEKLKDIDMFFRCKSDYEDAVNKYKDNDKYILYYKSSKVTAFKNKETGIVVELIKYIYGEPNEILDAFDFTITQFCLFFECSEGNDGEWLFEYYVLHHPKFFEHLHQKKLVLEKENHLDYPFNTFERSLRYTRYGYNLCKESKVNLIVAMLKADKFDESELAQFIYAGLD